VNALPKPLGYPDQVRGSSMRGIVIAIVVCLAIPRPATAAAGCADDQYQDAEGTVPYTGWTALHAHYLRFRDCDDGGLAEGYSDAVAQFLGRHWEWFEDLRREVDADPAFAGWILRHLDATALTEDLSNAWRSAQDRCPAGSETLCTSIAEAAQRALLEETENGGTFPWLPDDVVVGVIQETAVRAMFVHRGNAWWPLVSPDVATAGRTPETRGAEQVRAPLRRSFSWRACSGGRVVGQFSSMLADGSGISDLGIHSPEPPDSAPVLGKKSAQFSGWTGKPIHRPLVLTAGGTCGDSERWRSERLPAPVLKQILPALRSATLGIYSCDDNGKAEPYAYPDSRVEVRESYVARSGSRVVTLAVRPTARVLKNCEMLERPWEPHTFAVAADGRVRYLESALKFLDAGDYGVDGANAVIFKFRRYNHDGYTLFYEGFERSISYGWSYH